MTNEEIRIKVAESLGWKRHDKREDGFGAGQRLSTGWLRPDGLWERRTPNYPESLDACVEFEKVVLESSPKTGLRAAYGNALAKEVGFTGDGTWHDDFLMICATPLQRCLAYLKTKGLIP